jgi:hypothetical protein
VGGGRARLVAGEDGAQEEETLSWAGIGGVGGYEEVVCGEVASFCCQKFGGKLVEGLGGDGLDVELWRKKTTGRWYMGFGSIVTRTYCESAGYYVPALVCPHRPFQRSLPIPSSQKASTSSTSSQKYPDDRMHTYNVAPMAHFKAEKVRLV